MKMNQVNENTASVLEGAKPHCSRRGILFTFSRALIQFGLCVCYKQLLIDPGYYDSSEESIDTGFSSSYDFQNETDIHSCLPFETEPLQTLSATGGGGPTSSVTGGISTLAVSLNPFSATEKGGGDQRLLLQIAFRHYSVYADPDPLPPRVRPPHATATTLLLTRRQGEGVELTASFYRLPTGEILHHSAIR